MSGGSVPANIKRTSALRRVPPLKSIRIRLECGGEGDVCAFELPRDASPITVESPAGRMMAIAPGDAFLATPGWIETRRMAVGGIPDGGLVPGGDYWVLSYCGVVGELISCHSASQLGHLGRVRYLGAVCGDGDETLNIRQFGVAGSGGETDRNAPVYLILGTSSEVGKTTAGVAVLRALRMQGHSTVVALKATGTPGIAEIAQYQDFGAQAFDCIDFGLPTTFPPGRPGIDNFLGNMLDFCLSLPADAVVVECAGDPVSANAPVLLSCLKARRGELKITLAAADALGAMGAKHALAEIGLKVSLITGPCTDTSVLRQRTEALCGIPAINMAQGPDELAPTYVSRTAALD